MSYPLMVDCPTCGKTYDYSDSEEKFWQRELPPPPEWIFGQTRCATASEHVSSREGLTCSRIEMDIHDDELRKFETEGAPPLPVPNDQGYVEHDGARIWYSSYGPGSPVILLHGGLGRSGNWGYQVPALIESGYRAVLIDSRGHGRSTREEHPFSYELMASDVLAVTDTLHLKKAVLVGWSDGACAALILAAKVPSRAAGVFYFACNMDPGGVKPFEATPTVNRCFARHAKDYAELSATPEDFKNFVGDVNLMGQTQPNYSAKDLAKISVPVVIVQSEHDEFIKREHAEYLARSIPNAEYIFLKDMSHFAPLQRPRQFNAAVLKFVAKVLPREGDNGASSPT
jgi:pimeloyl-ACP methyl ester carboxylesterase